MKLHKYRYFSCIQIREKFTMRILGSFFNIIIKGEIKCN